jgi:hypothetical protein
MVGGVGGGGSLPALAAVLYPTWMQSANQGAKLQVLYESTMDSILHLFKYHGIDSKSVSAGS